MTIRLYLASGPAVIHIAGATTTETFCGIDLATLQVVGTIDTPSAFSPRPAAIHDDCLTVFRNRHDQDLTSSGENLGWKDMGG